MALVEPSRPQSAFWIWQTEHREAISKEAGSNKGSVVGKLSGEKWKAMSAEAKKPYETKGIAAKAAYEKAMEAFKAAGGEPGKRRQEKKDAKDAKAEKKAKKEARKNSGAPKRPTSAFWLWQTENRDALVKEAGTNKIPVLGKLAGEKWGKLSAPQKAPYEKRAVEAKALYEKAMAEWKASNPDNANDDQDEDGEDAEEPAEVESPPKKARKTTPEKTEKAAAKPAEKAEKAAAKPAKAKAKAKSTKADKEKDKVDEIDPAALKNAQDLGLEAALRNLANRDEIKQGGISANAMVKALQKHGGLVNKAKQALLAGA